MLKIKNRFRSFLPVVIDIETAGVVAHTDAMLEICAIPLEINSNNKWQAGEIIHQHVEPFEGANLCPKSLEFIGMKDPYHPFRFAKPEIEVLKILFSKINILLKQHRCTRAVLVGHNAWFDLLFLKAAWERCKLDSPFHSFTSFDTATLSGLIFGQTVLAKACHRAKIKFDANEAHSAIYDAEKTAELFCKMINDYDA